ncbi:hypothetical protein PAXRUDRAFT_19089 [Paxillus rubicundulus Ve08.2h10]|uniref:Unplaced genomic scaffold scaffold_3361, whole genome shotgun sequence n=1 Tax=Paxillus rubicundulus Ve08.2h10 TaxID=930991 RepID=A0A0D0BV83_9AGAM|nr:hypothetical protein PAXRUDRAFT_19089 [Paxillus rubicundulus Ve08.2h10]
MGQVIKKKIGGVQDIVTAASAGKAAVLLKAKFMPLNLGMFLLRLNLSLLSAIVEFEIGGG